MTTTDPKVPTYFQNILNAVIALDTAIEGLTSAVVENYVPANTDMNAHFKEWSDPLYDIRTRIDRLPAKFAHQVSTAQAINKARHIARLVAEGNLKHAANLAGAPS
jgi:hypothetical protein